MILKKIIPVLALALVPAGYVAFFYSSVDASHSPVASVQANTQVQVSPDATVALAPPPVIAHDQVDMARSQVAEPEVFNSPIDRIRAIQEKTQLHQSILTDHQAYSRYPAKNQRIETAAQDPLTKRYSIDERTTMSEDKDSALTVWSDKKYYLRGEQVKVFASIQDELGQRLVSDFAAQLIFDERHGIHQFDFTDENQDGVYELEFTADQIEGKLLSAGVYKVLIVNKTNALADAVAFVLSDPGARFTGNYRDAVTSDGDLRVEAEVEVSVKDRFYFQASLYTQYSDPIGSTQATLNLDKGSHWVPLDFYGLMIRDAGENGPYLLKQLSLAKVTLPMQRAPLIMPGYLTDSYVMDQFTATRYEQLAKLQ